MHAVTWKQACLEDWGVLAVTQCVRWLSERLTFSKTNGTFCPPGTLSMEYEDRRPGLTCMSATQLGAPRTRQTYLASPPM